MCILNLFKCDFQMFDICFSFRQYNNLLCCALIPFLTIISLFQIRRSNS